MEFAGGCHCGTFKVWFEPTVSPGELPLRQCACSFCRKHGATTATDPAGSIRITIDDPAEAVRYRFATGSADYLVCSRCGVYVAAVLAVRTGAVATLNVNVLDERERFTQTPQPVDYGEETSQARRLRRAERWTLATIVVTDPDDREPG